MERRHDTFVFQSHAASTAADALLNALQQNDPDKVVGDLLEELLVDTSNNETPLQTKDLEGLYEVSFVKTIKENENPVGGAWTRKRRKGRENGTSSLASTRQQKQEKPGFYQQRRSFQHILGRNETGCSTLNNAAAEVVNIISLSSFWGRFLITVILRGDLLSLTESERKEERYQALTSRALRAVFDAPRISWGGRPLQLGPTTSLVLDTPFCNDQVRIGVGARSGTRFVFRRCNANGPEANEFRALLSRPPVKKASVVTVLGASTLAGVVVGILRRGALRVVGSTVSLVSLFLAVLITLSGGGIEARDPSVAESKSLYSQQQRGVKKTKSSVSPA